MMDTALLLGFIIYLLLKWQLLPLMCLLYGYIIGFRISSGGDDGNCKCGRCTNEKSR